MLAQQSGCFPRNIFLHGEPCVMSLREASNGRTETDPEFGTKSN